MDINKAKQIVEQYQDLLKIAEKKALIYATEFLTYKPDLIEDLEIVKEGNEFIIMFKTSKYGSYGAEWNEYFGLDINMLNLTDEQLIEKAKIARKKALETKKERDKRNLLKRLKSEIQSKQRLYNKLKNEVENED